MASVNPMKCTKEMTFPDLCCAPWKSLIFDVTTLASLKGNQGPSNGASGLGGQTEIIKLCTSKAAGMDLMSSKHQAAVSMPVECVNGYFSDGDLQGSNAMAPGEIFLRARILWFMEQDVPGDSIPTCAQEVTSCSNGETPTYVSSEWLQAQLNSASASLLLQSEVGSDEHAAALVQMNHGVQSFGFGGMGSGSSGKKSESGFSGGLVTSGSFSMMASSSM